MRMLAQARPRLRPASLIPLYLTLICLPYAVGLWLGRLPMRGVYTEAVTLLTLAGMAVLLVQFFLSGRVELVNHIAGVDESLRWHRKVGEILALIFLLHPFLILAPRILVSGGFAGAELWSMFSQPLVRTGFYAWGALLVLVLVAMFRDRLALSYEAWRISHGVAAAAIAILATDHAINVGRHGMVISGYNQFWLAACALSVMALFNNYLLRPLARRRRPFRLVSVEAAGRSDWLVTLEKDGSFPFSFTAGQFVWINTSGNPFSLVEHPFSIASAPSQLPRLQFIVRALGDFTGQLGDLAPGQRVYLDGPHGAFTLSPSGAEGIGLIAGGAGIGPIMGLLRHLAADGDQRPIRLIYGNQTCDQMVLQDEIADLCAQLDCEQILAVVAPPAKFSGHKGVIDRAMLAQTLPAESRLTWDHYVCGPPIMVKAVAEHLRGLGVPPGRIIYEQLAF